MKSANVMLEMFYSVCCWQRSALTAIRRWRSNKTANQSKKMTEMTEMTSVSEGSVTRRIKVTLIVIVLVIVCVVATFNSNVDISTRKMNFFVDSTSNMITGRQEVEAASRDWTSAEGPELHVAFEADGQATKSRRKWRKLNRTTIPVLLSTTTSYRQPSPRPPTPTPPPPPTTTTTTTTPTTTSPTVISTTTTQPTTANTTVRRPDHVDRYVSFAGGFADGRGLGNQIFDLATVIYVAELTGRQPAILTFKYRIALDEVFDLQIERYDDLCPCYQFGEDGSLWYDRRLEEFARGDRSNTAGQSIFVSGFFQSWKYTRTIDRRLRRHLTFWPDIRQFVEKFLDANVPPNWIKGFVRVGIHVRRGDVLNKDKIEFGYTTPNETYFHRAMSYFVDLFNRVQFIVVSNDMDWCRQHLSSIPFINSTSINVTFASGHSAGQDLALLSSCDHAVMSTGTYGWWGAWLAKGTTVYYKDWPRVNSSLSSKFRREDFFPPTWIGMS